MPDQHHRAAGGHHREHALEVLAQLFDGVGVRWRLPGLAVPALVVENHADLLTPLLAEPGALKMERSHPKAESVRENDS